MATNFWINCYNWLCVNDSDKAIGYGGGLSGRPTECRYCRYPATKGRCHGNHFCLSIFGVYTGVTWRILLNRPCTAAMRAYVKLL